MHLSRPIYIKFPAHPLLFLKNISDSPVLFLSPLWALYLSPPPLSKVHFNSGTCKCATNTVQRIMKVSCSPNMGSLHPGNPFPYFSNPWPLPNISAPRSQNTVRLIFGKKMSKENFQNPEGTQNTVTVFAKLQVHSGLSISDHVSVLENFNGLINHFLDL